MPHLNERRESELRYGARILPRSILQLKSWPFRLTPTNTWLLWMDFGMVPIVGRSRWRRYWRRVNGWGCEGETLEGNFADSRPSQWAWPCETCPNVRSEHIISWMSTMQSFWPCISSDGIPYMFYLVDEGGMHGTPSLETPRLVSSFLSCFGYSHRRVPATVRLFILLCALCRIGHSLNPASFHWNAIPGSRDDRTLLFTMQTVLTDGLDSSSLAFQVRQSAMNNFLTLK